MYINIYNITSLFLLFPYLSSNIGYELILMNFRKWHSYTLQFKWTYLCKYRLSDLYSFSRSIVKLQCCFCCVFSEASHAGHVCFGISLNIFLLSMYLWTNNIESTHGMPLNIFLLSGDLCANSITSTLCLSFTYTLFLKIWSKNLEMDFAIFFLILKVWKVRAYTVISDTKWKF